MKSGILFGLLLGSVTLLSGNEPFPEVYNSEADKSAEPPAAEEALKMMALPEGFEATVFAAEPDVRNPIAMTWDGQGRLWVAENYTYAERKLNYDSRLRDRVVILEDEDGDGRHDRRTVFYEKLNYVSGKCLAQTFRRTRPASFATSASRVWSRVSAPSGARFGPRRRTRLERSLVTSED